MFDEQWVSPNSSPILNINQKNIIIQAYKKLAETTEHRDILAAKYFLSGGSIPNAPNQIDQQISGYSEDSPLFLFNSNSVKQPFRQITQLKLNKHVYSQLDDFSKNYVNNADLKLKFNIKGDDIPEATQTDKKYQIVLVSKYQPADIQIIENLNYLYGQDSTFSNDLSELEYDNAEYLESINFQLCVKAENIDLSGSDPKEIIENLKNQGCVIPWDVVKQIKNPRYIQSPGPNYLISSDQWEVLLAKGLSALFTGAAYIVGDDVVNYIAEVLGPIEDGANYGFIKKEVNRVETVIGIYSSCPFFSISDKDVRVTKTRTYKWRTTSNRWTELTPETYLKNYFYQRDPSIINGIDIMKVLVQPGRYQTLYSQYMDEYQMIQ